MKMTKRRRLFFLDSRGSLAAAKSDAHYYCGEAHKMILKIAKATYLSDCHFLVSNLNILIKIETNNIMSYRFHYYPALERNELFAAKHPYSGSASRSKGLDIL